MINISVHSPWPIFGPISSIFPAINPEDWTSEHEKRIEKFLASGMSLGDNRVSLRGVNGPGCPTLGTNPYCFFCWTWPGQAKNQSGEMGHFGPKTNYRYKYFMIPYILITIIFVAFWAPQFFDQPTLLPTWLQNIDRPVFQTAYCTGDLCCSIAVLPSKNYCILKSFQKLLG